MLKRRPLEHFGVSGLLHCEKSVLGGLSTQFCTICALFRLLLLYFVYFVAVASAGCGCCCCCRSIFMDVSLRAAVRRVSGTRTLF